MNDKMVVSGVVTLQVSFIFLGLSIFYHAFI